MYQNFFIILSWHLFPFKDSNTLLIKSVTCYAGTMVLYLIFATRWQQKTDFKFMRRFNILIPCSGVVCVVVKVRTALRSRGISTPISTMFAMCREGRENELDVQLCRMNQSGGQKCRKSATFQILVARREKVLLGVLSPAV